jgi:zinc protease
MVKIKIIFPVPSNKRYFFINEHEIYTATMIPATTAFPGADDIFRVELGNGIVILCRANFNSPSIVVSGYLTAGSLFDPEEKLGLADFTATALMRGADKFNFNKIFDLLESAGASFAVSGATHSVSFNGKSLAEDLDLLLDILTEIIQHPTFPEEQIERLRAQLLTSLAMRSQDTGEMASLAFDRIVYKNHPYSRPEDGYPETIQKITREDLELFHRKHIGPQGMVLVIVGAVEPETAAQKVIQKLGEWKNPKQPEPVKLPPLKPLSEERIERLQIPGKFQSDIVLGTPGPERKSNFFIPATIGNNILGRFGMMGRLGDVVRENAGLAYHISSSLSGGLGPGPWYVSAGVSPDNVDKTIKLVREEIRRFVSEKVNEEELNDSKSNFIGRLPLSLESNAGVAAAIMNLERYQLGLNYYREYPELIQGVTAEHILEAAQKYLSPEHLAIAVAGP